MRRSCGHGHEGQALVEFSLIIPLMLVVVLSVAELGVIFGRLSSLGYSVREGARTGAALALGESDLCEPGNQDPSKVDAVLIAAIQRILDSPDSGIDTRDVEEIRIFKADSSGQETPGTVNIWTYAGEGLGPEVDPGPGVARIDFTAQQVDWPACQRQNSGVTPDSIGVTIRYTHEYVTPLPSIVNSFAGGGLSLVLSETTVMALNPTI
jgi:hypothetical protein